jgi:hypothetical protein
MGKGGATLAELIDLGRRSQKSSSIVLATPSLVVLAQRQCGS